MPLIDALRPDPSDDAQTVTLEGWAKEHGYDPASRTYTPTPEPTRAWRGAHPGSHHPDGEAA